VTRCLCKRPDDRFQSMTEVRAALERVLTKPARLEPSIAVLPFANMSNDKENEYFSDGLSEEIINALTHVPGLKVTARTSAFAFRGKEQDIRKIAEALDVKTVLEGSVRRSGSRIRVTAQLINAADGYHLWSERYDRELADVFAVQDEIAAAIAGALQVKLAAGVHRRYTPSLPSYEAYLRAQHEVRKLTPESLARGKGWYEQALALDPNFALAHNMFGVHFAQLANYGLMPAHEAMPLVRGEARTALDIDPALPHGHAVLGQVAALYDYDWAEAERRFALARAGDSVPSEVCRHLALYYLLPIGRSEEAAEECARALHEDPLNLLDRLRFAQCLRAAGRAAEASTELRRVLELDESLWFTHFIMGLEQLLEGQLDEALPHAEKAARLAPWNPSATGLLAAAWTRKGDVRRAEELLGQLRPGLELRDPARAGDLSPGLLRDRRVRGLDRKGHRRAPPGNLLLPASPRARPPRQRSMARPGAPAESSGAEPDRMVGSPWDPHHLQFTTTPLTPRQTVGAIRTRRGAPGPDETRSSRASTPTPTPAPRAPKTSPPYAY
jgi:serine/threonine-protein kinase